jgi:hypothetical protein
MDRSPHKLSLNCEYNYIAVEAASESFDRLQLRQYSRPSSQSGKSAI